MVGTVDDSLAGFQKEIIFQGVAGGADHQQKRSLLPVHVREPGHQEAFRKLTMLWWILFFFTVKKTSTGPARTP